jgi:hypothetical protein
MSNFLKQLIHNKYFNLRDVTMFHLLPDVPYYAGVYEVSNSAFGKMCGVDADTAKSFFEKLESSGLVTVLRSGSRRGKNASFAFTRKEPALHNQNYRLKNPSSPSRGNVLSITGPEYILYSDTLSDNRIPKNFFRPAPTQHIFNELLSLLSDPAYSSESVFTLLNDHILTSGKIQRRNYTSRVG